jgi:hypothetical protein
MSDDGAPNPLIHAQRGMQVYDANGDAIGEVATVYIGQGIGTISGEILHDAEAEHVIVEAFPDVLHPEDFPSELLDRMRREGYLRVARPGLEEVGSIILPDQIDSVSEEGIYLIP